ncbi:hypothetical protein ACQ4LE_006715 [Meloidogyne hapla]
MLADLNDFVYKEVLGGDPTRKSLFVLLEKGEEKAVLLCNKEAFEEDDNLIPKWIKTAKLHLLTKNDKYGNYEMALDPEKNLLKTTLIYPANDFDIQKYRRQEAFILYETPEDYKNITCNYLVETKQMENLKWVYNFLDKKSEEERIIFENPDKQNGFILAPDLKWNGTNLDELYLLAVAHRRDLHSIRDLTPTELPLLENIRDECVKIIQEKYGLKKSQLKMYFHYQPTFYHLHVHIVHIKYEAPGLGCTSILLDTVIENLKIFPDFYAKATLPFIRKESDPLYKKYEEAGRV